MKLLTIADTEYEEFEPHFDETYNIGVDQVAPEVVESELEVRLNGHTVDEFDAAFMDIPVKNAVFGRVMIEMIEEKNVSVNYPSTAFFVMAKKNYLYYVLHERGVPAPRTVTLATEKAARNIANEIEPPLIARRMEELEETETKKLDDRDEIKGFAEGSEYEEDVLIFHEYDDGDKYRCLVIGDQVISLKEDSESWRFTGDNLKYSNISDTQKEIVMKTKRALGTPVAEILIRGEQVFDIDPNPDLQGYSDVSGKNTFEAVAEVLKGEED
ncbi:MAG: RimK family alpha-L-glutamate ligase [Candidatus Nanohaloarchaea archaeon]